MNVSYDEKYSNFIRSGMSHSYIEKEMKSDGFNELEILNFWISIHEKSLEEAIQNQSILSPTSIWKSLKKFQKFEKVYLNKDNNIIYSEETNSLLQYKDKLKVVCISDTHGLHNTIQIPIPSGDIMIHAGDFTDTGGRNDVLLFNEWLGTLPHKYKIVIAGNHESTFDEKYYQNNWQKYGHSIIHDTEEIRCLLTNALYLQDNFVVIEDLIIYGTPWQPAFSDWAFNIPRGSPRLIEKWKKIKMETSILITHTPPLGRGDHIFVSCQNTNLMMNNINEGIHVGDLDLLKEIQLKIKPDYHIFGHVHEGYGVYSDGTTTYINASICNNRYQPINEPICFHIRKNKKDSKDMSIYVDYEYSVLLQKQNEHNKSIILSKTKETSFSDSFNTSSDIFQDALKKRLYSISDIPERGMKHLFSRHNLQHDNTSRIISEQPPEPDYSAPTVLNIVNSTKFKSKLWKRLTLSILPETIHTTDFNEMESNSKKIDKEISKIEIRTTCCKPVKIKENLRDKNGNNLSVRNRKMPLKRRERLARLPPTSEKDNEKDESFINNNLKNKLKIDIVTEIDCVLCKYKVSGHIHPKNNDHKQSKINNNKSQQNSSALKDHSLEITSLQARQLNEYVVRPYRRLSTWF